MKKIIIAAIIVMMLGLAACEQKNTASTASQDYEQTRIVNPWQDISEAKAKKICPQSFSVPKDAQNVKWSMLNPASSPFDTSNALIQLTFNLDGNNFTAKEQITGEKETDISDVNYKWTYKTEGTLKNWNSIKFNNYRYIDENGYVDLATWYDSNAGVSYSLSVAAKDLDGFDLQAIVEALHP